MERDSRTDRPAGPDWRGGLLTAITFRPPPPTPGNRLGWPGYDAAPALRWGEGPLTGVPAVVAVWDFTVHGGSFGERDAAGFAAAAAAALAGRRPLVSFLRSGGTRLQEGVAGLVGLPRAALALAALDAAGVAHVAVADQPTTGGVWVTIGSRADLRCAVLGATVGFAGPRVVAAVTGSPPPPGSHTATAAFAAGLVDAVLAPPDVEAWLRRALTALADPVPHPRRPPRAGPTTGSGPATAAPAADARDPVTASPATNGPATASPATASLATNGPATSGPATSGPVPGAGVPAGYARIAARSGWAQVRAARESDRADALDVLRALLPDGVALTGPDPVVVARLGTLAAAGDGSRPGQVGSGPRSPGPGSAGPGSAGPGSARAVGVAIGGRRGGAPGPDGYRLLTRAARLAGKLGIGLVTLVDTPGAANDADAEAAGVAAAIGDAMAAVLACPSPTVSVVVGEGGSGGALAAAVTDIVAMTPDSYFTALSPEGTAATLRVPVERAADISGLRPTDLYTLGFAHRLLASTTAAGLAGDIADLLDGLAAVDPADRHRHRLAIWSTGLRNSL